MWLCFNRQSIKIPDMSGIHQNVHRRSSFQPVHCTETTLDEAQIWKPSRAPQKLGQIIYSIISQACSRFHLIKLLYSPQPSDVKTENTSFYLKNLLPIITCHTPFFVYYKLIFDLIKNLDQFLHWAYCFTKSLLFLDCQIYQTNK